MKTNFKRIGLVAAVSALTAAYAGVAGAQVRSAGNTGDLALIPYYTVQDDWVTGVHITNTSAATQILKLRLRRGTDSADALDFNIVLSPNDVWAGSLDNSTGGVVFSTDDASCTAPVVASGQFAMPAIFAAGAEEGYLEVISMGEPINEQQPIALAAKHAAGVPNDCTAVATNFFANLSPASLPTGIATAQGNRGNALTNQAAAAGVAAAYAGAGATCRTAGGALIGPADTTLAGVCENNYQNSTAQSLSVSYFIRETTSGTEMGGNAIHVSGFSNNAWMTNQETGLFSGDVYGFDFPDLNGGPFDGAFSPATLRGRFNDLRDATVLGSSQVLNDWSVAAARNVSTDWVVTFPGQYTMLDYFVWITQGFSTANCGRPAIPSTGQTPVPLCDFRDIPVTADLTLYDREEGVITPAAGSLVISPAPPGTTNTLVLPAEVNVIEWTDGTNTPVLGSANPTTVDPSVLGDFGWASLSVSSGTKTGGQRTCFVNYTQNVAGSNPTTYDTSEARGDDPGNVFNAATSVCTPIVNPGVPMVGFVAWERSFPQNPAGSYGRLIDHAFK